MKTVQRGFSQGVGQALGIFAVIAGISVVWIVGKYGYDSYRHWKFQRAYAKSMADWNAFHERVRVKNMTNPPLLPEGLRGEKNKSKQPIVYNEVGKKWNDFHAKYAGKTDQASRDEYERELVRMIDEDKKQSKK